MAEPLQNSVVCKIGLVSTLSWKKRVLVGSPPSLNIYTRRIGGGGSGLQCGGCWEGSHSPVSSPSEHVWVTHTHHRLTNKNRRETSWEERDLWEWDGTRGMWV